jgi:tetratricopeptide (TPR) repeat protein
VGSIQQFFQLVSSNKDVLNVLLGSGILVVLARFVWWVIQQWRKIKFPPGDFPFEVIAPRSGDVLKRLLGGEDGDKLADRNIPYQDRVEGRNVRQELERLLVKAEEHHWMLILGKSGLGKTLEAAQLAASLNLEWTILNFTGDGWLDRRADFPRKEIGTDRKLLFFLDDLNRYMPRGKIEWSSKATDEPLRPLTEPFQARLLRALKFYEDCCGRENVWVIATARNETIPDHVGDPSAWEKLEWEKYPDLWRKFIRYDLAEPEARAIVQVLQETVDHAGIAANPHDFPTFAQSNDRTFRTIIENLRDLQRDGKALTLDTFLPKCQDIWERRYRRIKRKYPVADPIYDAVELLRVCGIVLADWTIAPTAQMILARRSRWPSLPQRWQIPFVVRDLIREYHIDNPQDGQIEAKGKPIEGWRYIAPLERLVLRLAKQHPGELLSSLQNFGQLLSQIEQPQRGLNLLEQAVTIQPDNFITRGMRGTALSALGRYEEAIASYDKALELKPDDDATWYNRGNALSALGRYEEAIASYDKALELKPDKHEAWYNRGNALSALGRYEEAIASYDKALELKPDDDATWYNRGTALSDLGRKEEAIASYDKALELKPDKHEAWYNRGNALSDLGRKEEAIASYDKALELKPDKHEAWNNRGNALSDLGRYEEAIASYDNALKFAPGNGGIFYNKACCYSLQGSVEQAIAMLQRARELNYGDLRKQVETDTDFESIRGDGRFRAWLEGLGK